MTTSLICVSPCVCWGGGVRVCVCACACAQECSPRRRTGDRIRGLVPVLDASTSERREPPSCPPDTGNRPQVFPCGSKHLNQHLAALLCAWTLEPAVLRLTWTIRYNLLLIRNFVLCSICDRLSRVGHTCQCYLGCDAGIIKVYWWRQMLRLCGILHVRQRNTYLLTSRCPDVHRFIQKDVDQIQTNRSCAWFGSAS